MSGCGGACESQAGGCGCGPSTLAVKEGQGDVVSFADGVTLQASNAAGASDVFTDPIAMRGRNRVSGILNLEYIHGTNAQLTLHLQGSQDRQHWIDLDSTAKASAGAHAIGAVSAPVAFVRYQLILTNSSGDAACTFDLVSKLDVS